MEEAPGAVLWMKQGRPEIPILARCEAGACEVTFTESHLFALFQGRVPLDDWDG